MKAIVYAGLISCISLAASAATPQQVQFAGSVQQDAAVPVVFDLHLPSGESAALLLSDGSRLELATPGSAEGQDGARIRLVSSTGEVLHTATNPDTGLASMSFAYRVCNGQATYMSPAPQSVPACSEE